MASQQDLLRNIDEFNREVAKIGDTLPAEQIVLLHKKVTFQLLELVLDRTPVKTGNAKNNWQVTIGSPATNILDPPVRTDKHKVLKDRDARSAEAGRRARARAQKVIERIKPYTLVWLANNVEYINELEGGSSKQAPDGMLALAVADVTTQFK